MLQNKIITADDILGKEVIDPDGEVLGIVIKLHIDKNMKSITGITLDQGFMKPDLFVGLQYIKNFGIDTVFLNHVPHYKYKGLEVLTSRGKPIGIIKDIEFKKEKINKIFVSKQTKFSKEIIEIKASKIDTIEDSVILKKHYKAKNKDIKNHK